MLCLPFLVSQARRGEATNPLRLANSQEQPERERLLHLVIGSTEGVRSAIHSLHVLNYAEQATWSQLITVPRSGILITPEQGEVFSLLRRDLRRTEL
ncbi:hypothetical protein [Phormidium tenue]|uniref:Uncharacterized protein n=1 Tax=Phormidium tenue NIES-30 TaxID=549789 RepID=A0A1U7JA86_9CYAN|nr:hypothetical protein [Phormidium tenue]MBD2230528.1 hypothetical protein [Phormidium tenue FACHB-1052]OKH50694.1 hypothetical protein NIES30_00950 [Phormidium tenue NIES-30]